MSEFKKGQLVAVKIPGATKWELRVFERVALTDEPFCVEVIVRRPENATGYCVCMESICPAEEVWPEIFLGQHNKAYTRAIDKLNAQIEWLCSNLAGALNEGKLCPPNARCDGRVECEDCWSFAAEIATEETCPQ